jgi:inner membrane protein
MDSFTQILLGVATAEVIAGRQLKNKTFLYGAVLGTIPDLDVVVALFMNPVSGVAIHRGLSHSVLFFVFLSPFLGWAIAKLEREKISLKRAVVLAFFGLFTHILLDAFTTWGTQILWPLPDRFALKTIFVIDPLYTFPLLISLIYVFRTKNDVLRHKYVIRGIAISSCYLLLTCGLKLFAVQKFENALKAQNVVYTEIIVKPTAFNTILWNANVGVEEGYLLADYSLLDTKPITFTTYKTSKSAEKLISHSANFKQLVVISEGWYIVTKQADKIYFNDLRFGLLTDDVANPQFAFSYEFIPTNSGIFEVKKVPNQKREGKLLLQRLWYRLQGN